MAKKIEIPNEWRVDKPIKPEPLVDRDIGDRVRIEPRANAYNSRFGTIIGRVESTQPNQIHVLVEENESGKKKTYSYGGSTKSLLTELQNK